MSGDSKLAAAETLINEFAAKLRALNDGRKIPTVWKIKTRKALDIARHGKAGRKHHFADVAILVRRLILARAEVRGERTKRHNPAKYKDGIAEQTGISRKTVERHMAFIDTLFGDENNTLTPELRASIIYGIADAIWLEIEAELDAEEKAHQHGLKSPSPE